MVLPQHRLNCLFLQKTSLYPWFYLPGMSEKISFEYEIILHTVFICISHMRPDDDSPYVYLCLCTHTPPCLSRKFSYISLVLKDINLFLFGRTNGPANPLWDRWFEGPQDPSGCRCWILWRFVQVFQKKSSFARVLKESVTH